MADSQTRYTLISADGHLNEPRDVWTSRVAKKDKDRVPRVDRLPDGDGWVFPGYDTHAPLQLGCDGGTPPRGHGPMVYLR